MDSSGDTVPSKPVKMSEAVKTHGQVSFFAKIRITTSGWLSQLVSHVDRKENSLLVLRMVYPASGAFCFTCLILAYCKKTLRESRKVFVEHAMHVFRMQF